MFCIKKGTKNATERACCKRLSINKIIHWQIMADFIPRRTLVFYRVLALSQVSAQYMKQSGQIAETRSKQSLSTSSSYKSGKLCNTNHRQRYHNSRPNLQRKWQPNIHRKRLPFLGGVRQKLLRPVQFLKGLLEEDLPTSAKRDIMVSGN